MKLLPAARMISATSRVGRVISSFWCGLRRAVSGPLMSLSFDGVGYSVQMPLGKMQIDDSVLQFHVAKQKPESFSDRRRPRADGSRSCGAADAG